MAQHRFWNEAKLYGLAGAISWVITVLVLFIPFRGESTVSLVQWDSPLGITVILLACIVVILYAIALFRHEQTLSFNDKKALVDKRQYTLSKLRHSVESRIKAANPLIANAEKLPLGLYWDKYLTHTLPYAV